jgi:hypothetical protein
MTGGLHCSLAPLIVIEFTEKKLFVCGGAGTSSEKSPLTRLFGVTPQNRQLDTHRRENLKSKKELSLYLL